MKMIKHLLACVPLMLGASISMANDGTSTDIYPDALAPQAEALVSPPPVVYILNPIDSVSINATNVWADNRHRAYYSDSLGNVNGFLLFDTSSIPDDANIVSMTLRVYSENAFGSPFTDPVVDVYYSADDAWTRGTVVANQLSLDVLLSNDTPFPAYVPSHDFALNVAAKNWTPDLIDDRLTIGFKNDVQHYSYVYFFGAYGSPIGQAPELIIEVAEVEPSLTISPPTGDYILTQKFDLAFLVETGALTIADVSAFLDGADVSAGVKTCSPAGVLVPNGVTLRCPGITGGALGVGPHKLDVKFLLSDGSAVSDSVIWNVRENVE